MKSLCLFASYFSGTEIPYYIQVYLSELKKQFSEVVFLYSNPELSNEANSFLQANNIIPQREKNEGFDFGLWYQAFQKIDVSIYNEIAFVNDSCILFKSLNEFAAWKRNNVADIKGMTSSESIFPHLQSYFLVLNKKAVDLTKMYFEKNQIQKTIFEVIKVYEIGLNKFWNENGLTIAAYIDNKGYSGEFAPYYYCINYHLGKGIPLIKKKILFASYRKDELFTLARMNFDIDTKKYYSFIRNQNDLILNPEKLQKENPKQMNAWSGFKYNFTKKLVRLYRIFK